MHVFLLKNHDEKLYLKQIFNNINQPKKLSWKIEYINMEYLRMCKIIEIRQNKYMLLQDDVLEKENDKKKVKMRKEGY